MRGRAEKLGTPRKPIEAVQIKTDGLRKFKFAQSLEILDYQINGNAVVILKVCRAVGHPDRAPIRRTVTLTGANQCWPHIGSRRSVVLRYATPHDAVEPRES